MAIIEFGIMVVGARGTIGGVTFSANRSGPFARAWSKGGNPQTPRQVDNRNVLVQFSIAWETLTAGQRTDWDDYAALPAQELFNSLGLSYFISGFNWFIRINMHLAQAGIVQRDDAPTLTRPAAPIIVNFTFRNTAGGPTTRWQLDASDPNPTMNRVAFLQVFNSQGRTTPSGRFTFMRSAIIVSGGQITFQTEAEASFGNILDGMKGFSTLLTQDLQGQRGPVVAASGIAF